MREKWNIFLNIYKVITQVISYKLVFLIFKKYLVFNEKFIIGVDVARTLMRKMGIEAICQKPHLSKPDLSHKAYSYLLKRRKMERVN